MIWVYIGIAAVVLAVLVLMMVRGLPETPLEEQARCLRIQEEEKAEKKRRKEERRQRRRDKWQR